MTSQIHDLGYRAYEGPRAGTWWAIRSLAIHSARRALGLKRAARHKIAPGLTIGFSYLPAVALVGIAMFIGSDLELIGYGEYYNTIGFALVLFVTLAAPGILTTDRTSGMLAMYLASPLNRTTYLVAKALALFAVMLLVTAGPIVFLVLAYTLAGAGPDGILGFAELLLRALVAGSVAGAIFTGLGLFVASLPRRWGIASVALFATLFVSEIVSAGLTEGADASRWFGFVAPNRVAFEAWQRILDDPVSDEVRSLDDFSTPTILLAALLYIVGGLGAAWYRYQNIEVER